MFVEYTEAIGATIVDLNRLGKDGWVPIPGRGHLAPFSASFGHSMMQDPVFVVLPHPSGLNRAWNEPGAFAKAQDVMRRVAPELPWGSADQ